MRREARAIPSYGVNPRYSTDGASQIAQVPTRHRRNSSPHETSIPSATTPLASSGQRASFSAHGCKCFRLRKAFGGRDKLLLCHSGAPAWRHDLSLASLASSLYLPLQVLCGERGAGFGAAVRAESIPARSLATCWASTSTGLADFRTAELTRRTRRFLRLLGFGTDLTRGIRRGFFCQPWLVHTQPCLRIPPIFIRLRCQESESILHPQLWLCELSFSLR